MPHDDHIGIEAHEFGGDLRNALEFSLGGTSFRDKVATFDIAALPHRLFVGAAPWIRYIGNFCGSGTRRN